MVLAGHFTVGERARSVDLETIAEARKVDADLGIVVNDIDFARRLCYFHLGGVDYVVRRYERGRYCGTSKDPCHVPSREEILGRIDEKAYGQALDDLRGLTPAPGREDAARILRETTVPRIVNNRLAEYGVDRANVFTERQLRNDAGYRTRSKHRHKSNNWRDALESLNLLDAVRSESTTPVCGGILLALYERVASIGYDTLVQLFPEQDRGPIENGQRIYEALRGAYPADPRWQLRLESRFF